MAFLRMSTADPDGRTYGAGIEYPDDPPVESAFLEVEGDRVTMRVGFYLAPQDDDIEPDDRDRDDVPEPEQGEQQDHPSVVTPFRRSETG